MARRYFGTDGVRGRVGESPITPDFVMRLGYAAGKVLAKGGRGRPAVLLGKDTRISGYMLESALMAGFCAAGVDVHVDGPVADPGDRLPDPGTAAVRRRGAECLAQSVRGQRHQVLLRRRQQAARRDGGGHRGAARRADRLRRAPSASARRSGSRRGRALHRVLQEHLPVRARPQGPEAGRGLRAWRCRITPRPMSSTNSAPKSCPSAPNPTAPTSTTASARFIPSHGSCRPQGRGGPRHLARRRRRPPVMCDAAGQLLRRRRTALRPRPATACGKGPVAGVVGTLMTNYALEQAFNENGRALRAGQGGRPLRAGDAAAARLAVRRREFRPSAGAGLPQHRRRHHQRAADPGGRRPHRARPWHN